MLNPKWDYLEEKRGNWIMKETEHTEEVIQK
jgi:hypothetical protein